MELRVSTEAAFLIGVVLGILIGWVILWSFQNPTVGRTVARILAIVPIGFGVSWLVTPIGDLLTNARDRQYESPLGKGQFGAALGWGAGALVAGVLVLVLSFLRTGGRAAAPKEEPRDHV
jgi:hypothetical protein